MPRDNCLTCANRLVAFEASHIPHIMFAKCSFYGPLAMHNGEIRIVDLVHEVSKYGCASYVQEEKHG